MKILHRLRSLLIPLFPKINVYSVSTETEVINNFKLWRLCKNHCISVGMHYAISIRGVT